jgi:PAS domain S-box-containing protein
VRFPRNILAAIAFCLCGLAALAAAAAREDGRPVLRVETALAAAAASGAAVFLLRAARQRKRLAAELESSRVLMQTVLDNVPASVYLMDLDGRMHFLNKECARTLGGTPDEIRGRTIRELFSAADAQKMIDNNKAIHAGGRFVEVEEAVTSADGRRVYLSMKGSFAARPGEPPLLCGVSTDITERKATERSLREANAELEAFSYSVSHDLRAPLRAIDGFARLLQEERGEALDAEGRRLLGRVRANVEKMGLLIDDLLAFSRLGRQALRESDVDMEELARRAAVEASAAEPERRVRLEIGAMPRARGDAAMLAVVWSNLFSNAYKYTRPRADAKVEAGGESGPEGLRYWIRDDGVGFDPAFKDKLFGVFQRLHRADEFEGTGVGLALVRRVVERHGGRVEAESAPERGAEFRFILPSWRDA